MCNIFIIHIACKEKNCLVFIRHVCFAKNMKKSNVTIVLSDEAKRIVKEDSSLFGGNMSAYITYLILDARKNRKAKQNIDETNMVAVPKEKAVAKKKRKITKPVS